MGRQGIELAVAYVSLEVATNALAAQVAREFGDVERTVAPKAGAAIGKAMAKGFEKESPDLDKLTAEFEAAEKKIVASEKRATTEQENLARKVEIAQAKKAEAISKYGEKSSQALTAIDRLAIAEQKLEAASLKAASEQEKLSKELAQAEKKLKGATSGTDALEDSLKAVDAAMGKAQNGASDVENAVDKMAGSGKKASSSWDRLGQSLKSAIDGDFSGAFQALSPAAERESGNVQGVFDAMGGASSTKFGGTFVAGLAASLGGLILAAGIGAIVSGAISDGMESEKTSYSVQASLGLSPEDAAGYSDALRAVYGSALGESKEQAQEAIDSLLSSFPKLKVDDSALESSSKKLLALNEAFEVDLPQSAQTASQLIDAGLAKDLPEALDLMAAGLQSVPKSLRDEYTDALEEYTPFLASIGYTGKEAFAILASATEKGRYGIDKAGDALKEFSIRGTDMSSTSVEAYEAMGMSAEEMSNRLLAGGETARMATDEIINGILGIEDPATRANTAIALFGAPLEDLGVNDIPKFLESLRSSGDALGDVEGRASDVTKLLQGGGTEAVERFKRGFENLKAETGEKLLGGLYAITDWAGKKLGPAFEAGGKFVSQAWDGLRGIYDVLFKGDFSGALHSAFGWDEDHPIVDFLFDVRDGAIGIYDLLVKGDFSSLLRNAFGWEEDSPIVDFLLTAREAFIGFVSDITDRVGPAVDWLWNGVIVPAFQGIQTVIGFAWNNIIWPIFTSIFDETTVLGGIFSWLYNFVIQPIWSLITGAINFAWGLIKFNFDAMIWLVRDGLGAAFQWLYDNVINPVWGWISDKISSAWDLIRPIFEQMREWAEKILGPAFETAKNAIGSAWDGIRGVILTPVRFIVETVYGGGIKPAFDNVAKAVGSDVRLPAPPTIPARRLGGYTPKGWTLVGEEGPELVNFNRPGMVYTAGQTERLFAAAGRDISPYLIPDRSYTQREASTAIRAMETGNPDLLKKAQGRRPEEAMLPIGGFSWGGFGKGFAKVWRGAVDTVADIGGKAIRFARGALADAASLILDPVKEGITGAMGPGLAPQIFGDAFSSAIDGVISWIRGIDEEDAASGPQLAAMGGLSAADMAKIPLGGGAVRPLAGGILTSLFGVSRYGGSHAGIDLAAPTGTLVRAFRDAVVAFSGWNSLAGRSGIGIGLQHAGGLGSYYGHLSEALVSRGQAVKAGQVIGKVGSTGNSTGPHLHWELSQGGFHNVFNPLPYLHDNGGWLPPGDTLVRNLTKKPEAVLTNEQWKNVEQKITENPADRAGVTAWRTVILQVGDQKFEAYIKDLAADEVEEWVSVSH